MDDYIQQYDKAFKYLNQHLNCDAEHYNQRSMVEANYYENRRKLNQKN